MMKDKATVTLFVNGEQPKEELEELRLKAKELQEELTRLNEIGDVDSSSKIQRQIDTIENQINVQELNYRAINNLLKNFPKDNKDIILKDDKAYRNLLKNATPGSDEWVEYAKQAYITQDLLRVLKDAEENVGSRLSTGNNRPTTPSEYRITEHQVNEQDYEIGLKSFTEYRKRMLEIEDEYNRLMSESFLISQKERDKYLQISIRSKAALTKFEHSEQEKEEKHLKKEKILQIEEEYRQEQLLLDERHRNELIGERAYQEQKFRNEMKYLYKLKAVYREDSHDRHEIERRIQRTEFSYQEKKTKEFLDMKKKIERSYFEDYGTMCKEKYSEEYEYATDVLEKIIEKKKATLNLNKETGTISSEDYDSEISKLEKMHSIATKSIKMHFKQEEEVGESFKRYWNGWIDEMGDKHDGLGEKLTKWVTPVASAMTSITQAMTESISTELEIRENKINQYYDKAIKAVQGNTYKEAKIEKKRQKELEKAKLEAQKKQMALQVISAIATTAQNAISAYGAGLQLGGIAGLIMAPIAAAAAIAAGAIQISTIKKQKELIQSQFSEGGYTKKGGKNEVAGVVHAGEWVAPKRMVDNPKTGAIISKLENLRQGKSHIDSRILPTINNNVGRIESIESSKITREIKISNIINRETAKTNEELIAQVLIEDKREDNRLLDTIDTLNKLLSSPIKAYIPMTGDGGLVDSSQSYAKLMNNVTTNRKKMDIPFTRSKK